MRQAPGQSFSDRILGGKTSHMRSDESRSSPMSLAAILDTSSTASLIMMIYPLRPQVQRASRPLPGMIGYAAWEGSPMVVAWPLEVRQH